jgi:hypothetical protein
MKGQQINAHLASHSEYNYLFGKVVLLIGNDTAVLPSLITQLAERGADIALIYQQLSLDTMRLVKENVESLGQRFLFLENPDILEIPTDQFIQSVTSRLDHIDVFIDLSVQNKDQLPMINGNEDPAIGWQQPNWTLMHKALQEIAKS